MQISLEQDKSGKFIKISAADSNALLYTGVTDIKSFEQEEKTVVLADTADIVSHRTDKGGLIIASVGEFEKDEIFISAHINNVERGEALDVVELEADGVRALYYSAITDVNKDLLSELGVIDVLLISVAEDFTNQLKAVSSIDPQMIVPLGFAGGDIEKFKVELGVKFTEEKKLKLNAVDFANEDYVLQGVTLQS